MASARLADRITEFLAFNMGQEEYGLDITQVQEIRQYEAVTRIANAPEYVKGVMDLRGVIVPVIDMRMKLGLGDPGYDEFTIVIVLQIRGSTIGMVVDKVSDVITLAPEHIRPAPELGNLLATEYLIGLGTIDQRMVILVDIDTLMSSDDIGLVRKLAA